MFRNALLHLLRMALLSLLAVGVAGSSPISPYVFLEEFFMPIGMLGVIGTAVGIPRRFGVGVAHAFHMRNGCRMVPTR